MGPGVGEGAQGRGRRDEGRMPCWEPIQPSYERVFKGWERVKCSVLSWQIFGTKLRAIRRLCSIRSRSSAAAAEGRRAGQAAGSLAYTV